MGLPFALLLGSPVAHAQPLKDELARLLVTHPQIKAARKLLQAGAAREDEAFGEFLPRAEFTGETGPETVNNSAERNNGENFDARRDKVKIQVTQNLFKGFGDMARLKEAENSSQVLAATLDATKQAIFLEGITAYLNVLREKKLIEVAQLNERNIQNQLRLEDERVQRGAGITVDVLQAKSRLQIARERRVAFEGRQRAAIARYQQVFDQAPDLPTLEDVRPNGTLVPSSLEEALSMARGGNPNARVSEFTTRVNEARREVENSEFYPTLDLVGSAEYEDNTSGIEGSRNILSLFVRSRWEFFSGLKTRARVEAANRTYQASKDTFTFTLRKVDEEVRIAWENLKTQRDRVDLLNNAVAIADEVLKARRRLREAGKETALNVLDAEGEVFNAQINQIEADYDSRLAVYRVIFATGNLDEETLGLPAQ
ncbi:MAG: TolC family outer membrane protein [Alphaproteobacteria bacterium]|nr:TolC family outer membrane protein [Alphaproteobacteria bacterium]